MFLEQQVADADFAGSAVPTVILESPKGVEASLALFASPL